MKKIVLAIGLAAGLATNLFAGETLHLKLKPDRPVLLKGHPQEVVVKIDLSAASDRKKPKRAPLNLAVVLDRSGSMTGAKIEKAKQAAAQLVDRLSANDIFCLVVYSDEAKVLVPAQKVEDKAALKHRIAHIEAGGSTALYAGVEAGAEQIEEFISGKSLNRIILLSDGLANVGPSSTHDVCQLGRTLSRRGIAVTTIGVGDDYNEDLMAGLAEASDANYYYVQDTEMLPQIFAKELGDLTSLAACDIRIEITCPDGVKQIGFIGRTETFKDQKATVKLSQLTSGQDRCLFLRCRVNKDEPEIARVKVIYADQLDDGKERCVDRTLQAAYTGDAALAASSLNFDVIAEGELIQTAVTKAEALSEADAGNYREAARKLKDQATALDDQYQNAPAAVQLQIRSEAENLRNRSQQLQQGQYDSAIRKSIQWESFNGRNSK